MAAIMGGIGGYLAGASAVGTTVRSTASKGFVASYAYTLPATTGQQALAAGVSVASSYMGINMPIGNSGLSVGLSPALFMGNGGMGLGFNAGVSYANENFAIGMSYGKTYWRNHVFTGGSFAETRFGYSAAIGSHSLFRKKAVGQFRELTKV